MAMNDTLAAAMSRIHNAEKIGKQACTIEPASKIIRKVLDIMRDEHYIGEYAEGSDTKNVITVNLLGKINRCGAIKPRFAVKKADIKKYEKRYLPAQDFGFIVLSTPQGYMTHTRAKEKNIGGRLVAYFY